MEILNAEALERAARKFPQLRTWLEQWKIITEGAEWKNLVEVRAVFPAADGIPLGKGKRRVIVTCFNAGGNDYRLLTRIRYDLGLLQIEEVLTHAEYSKGDWKKTY